MKRSKPASWERDISEVVCMPNWKHMLVSLT